jgi:hypothetical protein
MPRRPRIHLDGVPLHIVQRGHNRQPCFFDACLAPLILSFLRKRYLILHNSFATCENA